jgi:hypothetical protein
MPETNDFYSPRNYMKTEKLNDDGYTLGARLRDIKMTDEVAIRYAWESLYRGLAKDLIGVTAISNEQFVIRWIPSYIIDRPKNQIKLELRLEIKLVETEI